MTSEVKATATQVITVPIANTLDQQYLLDTDVDRRVDLRFLHQHPQTSSNISILIIARSNAAVDLSATVSIKSEMFDAIF